MNEEIVKLLIMNTLGESVLVETLRSASYFISRTGNGYHPKFWREQDRLKEGESCYYFVQGTGLDILIEYYDLGYNPNEVRDQFNYWVRHA